PPVPAVRRGRRTGPPERTPTRCIPGQYAPTHPTPTPAGAERPHPPRRPVLMSAAEERAAEVRRTCIEVAAWFVAAQPDGPDRALARHSRRPDGTCAGCRTTPVP